MLHHVAEPDRDLRTLRDVLAPGGALLLMLYATYGRAGVYMVQEYCRRLGIGTTPDEIDVSVTGCTGLDTVLDYVVDFAKNWMFEYLVTQVEEFGQSSIMVKCAINAVGRATDDGHGDDMVPQMVDSFARWFKE